MVKLNRINKSINRLILRLITYILTSFVIPFALKIIKKKLTEQKRLLCYECNGKLEKINKYEYYCKNCKIIRKDQN